ncbi:MAG: hypothetical protein WC823_00155 [Parcubacteria group bacterium]|jgi:hypothetical protein
MKKQKKTIKKKVAKKPAKRKAVVEKTKLLPLMPKPLKTPKSPKKDKVSVQDVAFLEKAFEGDKEMTLFFLAYLKHDRNASKAYKFLHPGCTDHSSRVLGSRQLAKVSISMILDSYGLGVETYIKKIKEGLEAANYEKVSVGTVDKLKNGKIKKETIYKIVESPNHQVQKAYHESLGKLLGIEGKKDDTAPNISVQVNNLINDKKNKYGI